MVLQEKKNPQIISGEIIKQWIMTQKVFRVYRHFWYWIICFWLEVKSKLNTKSKPLKYIFAPDTSLSVTPCSSLLWGFFHAWYVTSGGNAPNFAEWHGTVGNKKRLHKRRQSDENCIFDSSVGGIKSVVGERCVLDAVLSKPLNHVHWWVSCFP